MKKKPKKNPEKKPKNLTGKSIVTPQGKIRPGNSVPFQKCTEEERDRRVQVVVDLIAQQATKFQIHDVMRERYGLHWRTVDDIYIVRARKLIRERSKRNKDDVFEEAVAFYERLIRGTADNRVKMAARERLDEIFGIDAPRIVRNEISGPNGEAIKTEQKLREFDYDRFGNLARALFGVVEGNGSKEPLHPSHADSEAGAVSGGNGR